MSKTNIYVLRLENGRYYVGKSDNIISRYKQHLNGNGSAWTKKYKPVALEKVIENVSSFEEDKVTKEYMSKYGIEKVRGGSYVLENLPKFQEEAVKKEIWGANDSCMSCGRKGHWANDCYASRDVTGKKKQNKDDDDCYDLDKDDFSDIKEYRHINKKKQNYYYDNDEEDSEDEEDSGDDYDEDEDEDEDSYY